MTSEKDEYSRRSASHHRRRFLQGVGVAGITGVLAGCLGGDDENGDENDSGNGDNGGGNGENGGGNGDNGDTEPASFEVSNLDPDGGSVIRGNSVQISATIENTGDEDGEGDVELAFDGESQETVSVDVGGGEESDVSFEEIDTESLEPNEYEYQVSTDDDEASSTVTVEGVLGDEPDGLLEFDDDVLGLSVGSNTIEGSLNSGYSVGLEDGEVVLEVPDGWEVTSQEGTSFDAMDAFGDQAVTWEIEVPDDASGEYDLTFDVSYASGPESAEVEVVQTAEVLAPMSAPFGMDCGGVHTDETVTIDGLEFFPTPDQSQAIDVAVDGNPTLQGDQIWWPTTVSTDPDPSSNANTWNEEYENFAEIENTDHDTLYQTEHWAEGELSYTFLIENGTYDVTLHVSEFVQTGEEARVFSAHVNGDPVFEDLDIYAEHGPLTAATYTHTVEVEDQELVVALESSVENPKIAGIEIRAAD